MPGDRLARQLGAAGYSAITGLEADDGFWKGKAVHNGRMIKFRVILKLARLVRKAGGLKHVRSRKLEVGTLIEGS